MTKCTDRVILDLWHPLYAVDELSAGRVAETMLLEERLGLAIDGKGGIAVWRARPDLRPGDAVDPAAVYGTLPARLAYGYVWASLGTPDADIFPIPEFQEPDRRRLNAATLGVNVSAPRAIENFLDMGHFPYVHTDILGAEPHTEVKEYDVEISTERDEILATRCRFF